ncbi:MAG: DUF1592 domain-containing protein [Planctomycetota bacterium]
MVVILSAPVCAQELPPLVATYCGGCHTGTEPEGEFDVDALFAGGLGPDTDARASEAVQRLRARIMPPADEPQPTGGERVALAAAFAALQPSDPEARVATVRRLSRVEYERTVRALFGIAWDGAALLPSDPSASGFDNQGDVLNVSPLHFEKYLDAADAIARAVVADAAARARAFGSGEDPRAALARLLEQAFRRPPSAEELAERLQLVADLEQRGVAADDARAAALRSILASPAFLFRSENGSPDAPWRLDPYELAVRLSYFLTSAPPDEALLARARAGDLSESAVLTAQARRLLAADGGRALADGFAAQWLRFREVLTAPADFRRYPQIWNHRLRPSLYEEAALFFAEVVREGASILTLLDADFTYANATLAKLYELPSVEGDTLRRVALPDRRRGGVLGMGATLMVSSYPLRTSPVRRGKWILDALLDAPPPPPPPGAGTLPADDKQDDGLTVRARMERHRRDKACASCHVQMDPLGFALENYDVLGRWRTEVHGTPVDARATLPDGTALDGPVALKDALLARKADFARAFAGKLLVYAIGRPLVPADEVEVAAIVQATIAGGYRFDALLEALVTSRLFTWRDPAGPRRIIR